MEENKAKIAADSLIKVSDYKKCRNYGRAFAHYMLYLELSPNERIKHEKQFISILSSWCIELEHRSRYEDLYTSYLQGLHYFPLSVELLNNFGAHLLRLEQDYQAKKYLQLAYSLDPQHLPTEKNLASVKQSLVSRWHFIMLNDNIRNKKYYNAIMNAINAKYNKVLDIGTGCGLLTLCASKNVNTKQIIAIEESSTMYKIAKDVFKSNNITNITIHNKNSIELSDISKSNVLITEIFDAGLFGEHFLKTLIHAHNNLLEKDCVIVPSGANIYVVGIECWEIHKHHKFVNCDLKHLMFKDLCIRKEQNEPYEAENIKNYDFKILTDVCKFATVDFKDLNRLTELYQNKFSIDPINLTYKTEGTLHAFLIFFELEMGTGNKISTNPLETDRCECWEQAVVYAKHPLIRNVGKEIKIQISCVDDILEIETFEEVSCDCEFVSQSTISFLNDHSLLEKIESVSENFQGDNLIVLDLFPIPIFGMNLAARNSHIFTISSEVDLVKRICSINAINTDNITFISETELYRYLECKNIFDIIFYDPITKNGTLNEKFYSNYNLFLNSLKENGLILPQSVRLSVQIVESEYLGRCCYAQDSNLLGSRLAEFINEYAVFEHWQLDNRFNYEPLSDAITSMISFNCSEPIIRTIEVPIVPNKRANSIIYWFVIDFFNGCTYSSFDSFYYKKACFVSEHSLESKKVMKVTYKQHKGFIKLSFN